MDTLRIDSHHATLNGRTVTPHRRAGEPVTDTWLREAGATVRAELARLNRRADEEKVPFILHEGPRYGESLLAATQRFFA